MKNKKTVEAEQHKSVIVFRALYDGLPATVKNWLEPLRKAVGALRSLRVDVWQMSGPELHSKSPISIAYLGKSADTRNYWFKRVFGNSTNKIQHRKIPIWQVARWQSTVGRAQNIVLIESQGLLQRFTGQDGMFIPNWVGGYVSTNPEDLEVVLNKRSVLSDLRVIKRNGLTYRISKDLAAFDDFYYQMYLPFIAQAHGDTAVVMSYAQLSKAFEYCELLTVWWNDEAISGVLINYSEELPKLWSTGVRNGDTRLLAAGATSALYYFGCSYLSEKGYKKVNVGSSRPFMRDGVLRFKKKWNVELGSSDAAGVVMNLNLLNEGLKYFLEHNPFIFQEQDLLKAAIFVNSTGEMTAKNFTSLLKEYDFTGVDKILLANLTHGNQENNINVPVALQKKIIPFLPDSYFKTLLPVKTSIALEGNMQAISQELQQAAKQFIQKLLALRAGERVLVYTDIGTDMSVARAVAVAAEEAGADINLYSIASDNRQGAVEELKTVLMSKHYDAACELSDQYFYPTAVWGEGLKRGTRFYSLQGLNKEAFVRCFRGVNYTLMDQFGQALVSNLKAGRNIQITTDAGTDLSCTLGINLL
ncbi:MAG: hypothetical protein R3240_10460, partial [Gammaproteobacteria bacterium]|nr:hypothetical protein [Gammaproteobacteria bacterium]